MLEQLKDLRVRTGCGMGDCQAALKESDGDLELAVEILRKKGIAKAAKRADRETRQGVIKLAVSPDHQNGWMISAGAETDFVVKNQSFQDLADKILQTLKSGSAISLDQLFVQTMPDGQTVKDNLDSLSGVLGEKLALTNCAVLKSGGTVAAYLHTSGHIGVLVALDQPGQADLAKDIAMQIAAANPLYVSPADVPAAESAKEKEIYREQLLAEGRPEAMLEKIMAGKLQKYYQEVCLENQEYIKDDKKRVSDILDNVKVERFIRFAL